MINATPINPKAEYTDCTSVVKGTNDIKRAKRHNNNTVFTFLSCDIFSTTATPDETAVVSIAKQSTTQQIKLKPEKLSYIRVKNGKGLLATSQC